VGSGEQQIDEPVADGPRLADVQQLASLPRGGGIARGAARGEDEVSPERLRAGRTGVGQRRCRGLPTIRRTSRRRIGEGSDGGLAADLSAQQARTSAARSWKAAAVPAGDQRASIPPCYGLANAPEAATSGRRPRQSSAHENVGRRQVPPLEGQRRHVPTRGTCRTSRYPSGRGERRRVVGAVRDPGASCGGSWTLWEPGGCSWSALLSRARPNLDQASAARLGLEFGGQIRASTTSPFTSIIQAMGLRAKRSLRQKSGSNWPVFSVSRMRRALLASVLFGTPLAALNWSVVRWRRQGRIVEGN